MNVSPLVATVYLSKLAPQVFLDSRDRCAGRLIDSGGEVRERHVQEAQGVEQVCAWEVPFSAEVAEQGSSCDAEISCQVYCGPTLSSHPGTDFPSDCLSWAFCPTTWVHMGILAHHTVRQWTAGTVLI